MDRKTRWWTVLYGIAGLLISVGAWREIFQLNQASWLSWGTFVVGILMMALAPIEIAIAVSQKARLKQQAEVDQAETTSRKRASGAHAEP